MTTVAEVIRRVSRLFGDTDKVFVIDQDYFDFINDGQREINQRVGEITTQTSAVAASTFPIAVPATFSKMVRLVYGQTPLQYVALEELDATAQDLTDVATPQLWFIKNDQICLFPLQPSNDSTQVYYEYVAIPTLVTATGNNITIPDMYLEELVNFCLAKCHERNQNVRAQEVSQSKFNNGMSVAIDDAFNKDETYAVIRDDPMDTWFA